MIKVARGIAARPQTSTETQREAPKRLLTCLSHYLQTRLERRGVMCCLTAAITRTVRRCSFHLSGWPLRISRLLENAGRLDNVLISSRKIQKGDTGSFSDSFLKEYCFFCFPSSLLCFAFESQCIINLDLWWMKLNKGRLSIISQ